jgi:hypothetical protein
MVATKANSQILKLSYVSKAISLFALMFGVNFGMAGIALSLAASSFVTWVLGLIMMLGFSRKVFIDYMLPVVFSLSGLYLGLSLESMITQSFQLPKMLGFLLRTIIISSLAFLPSFAIRSVRDIFFRQ